jgi:dihydroceramide fatty acyl 2-hydroxylase
MTTALTLIGLVILGAISWTLAEYLLHRFWGHQVPKGIFYREHTRHHFVKDYFASWKDKMLMAVVVCSVLGTSTVYYFGWLYGATYTLSFVAMYLTYEKIHAYIHHTGPKNSYAAKMTAHHYYHHFIDETQNHGVTTDFWDKVFGTYVKAKNMDIPVPQKFAMEWIDKHEIDYQFDDGHTVTYTIVKKHKPVKYSYSATA